MAEAGRSVRVPKTAADYRAAIDECMQEVGALHDQMDRDQAEIGHLKAQTAEIVAHTDETLALLETRLRSLESSR